MKTPHPLKLLPVYIVWCFFLLVPLTSHAAGATLDASQEGDNTTGSKGITISSSADLATLSIVGADNSTNTCTATLGGSAMTQAVRNADATIGVSETILYLVSPGSGAKTLVVSGCTSYTYTLNSYISGGMLFRDSGSASSGSANHIDVSLTLSYTHSLVVYSCQGSGGTNEACGQGYAGHPRYGGGTYSLDATPAGAYTVTLGFGGQTWTNSSAAAASFAPPPPAPPNATTTPEEAFATTFLMFTAVMCFFSSIMISLWIFRQLA